MKATIVASSLVVKPGSLNFVRGWSVRVCNDGRRSPDRLFRVSTCYRREDSFQVVPLPLLGRSLSFLDTGDEVSVVRRRGENRRSPLSADLSVHFSRAARSRTRGNSTSCSSLLLFCSLSFSCDLACSIWRPNGPRQRREIGDREERGAVPLARKLSLPFVGRFRTGVELEKIWRRSCDETAETAGSSSPRWKDASTTTGPRERERGFVRENLERKKQKRTSVCDVNRNGKR